MRSFVVYAGLALVAGATLVALRRRTLGIVNEPGLRLGAAVAASLMTLLALKSLLEMLS